MPTTETTSPGSKDDLAAADEYYRERLEIERENGDREGEAESLDNLGLVAQSRGDSKTAEEYHQRSLAIKRDIDDREGEAESLGNLGLVARSQGDLEAAEDRFQRSIEIQGEIGDREGEARSLGNLGLVYFSQDSLSEAKTHLERGARQLVDLGVHHDASKLIRTLVGVCEQLECPDEAVEWCETGMQITSQSGDQSLQRELSVLYAQLSGRNVADSTEELYYHALGHLIQGRGGGAALFEQIWEHRSQLDEQTDVYPITISAGVYLAGLRSVTDEAPEEMVDSEEILSQVGADYHRLPDAVTSLYEQLAGGETDRTPEELRERAAESDSEPESDELTFEAMERRSVARLLDHL